MLVATASIVIFNLTDTYFIGMLGGKQLAAISYTFPVVMFLGGIVMGLGMGAGSAVARRVGARDNQGTSGLATSVAILGFLLAMVVAPLGVVTFDTVFGTMGADEEILPIIYEYMIVWYSGSLFFIAPMLGNAVLRATGDTKSSMITMSFAAGMNIILDPVLIFGIGPIPALGMAGAAWATIISRAATLVVSIYILHVKMGMIRKLSFGDFAGSISEILKVGGPAVGVNILQPIAIGAVTAMVSGYGQAAVAGFGVGTRVEAFAFMPVMSMSAALMPFVGQNMGARLHVRIRDGISFCHKAALLWGGAAYTIIAVLAPYIAMAFSDSEPICDSAALYMRLGFIAIPMAGVFHLSVISFNALGRPGPAAVLNLSRMFILLLPLAYIGHLVFGLDGLFFGMAMGTVLGGALSWGWIRAVVARLLDTAIA